MLHACYILLSDARVSPPLVKLNVTLLRALPLVTQPNTIVASYILQETQGYAAYKGIYFFAFIGVYTPDNVCAVQRWLYSTVEGYYQYSGAEGYHQYRAEGYHQFQ